MNGAVCFGEWDVAAGSVTWSAPLQDLLGVRIPAGPVPLTWWDDRVLADTFSGY